jgi:Domain of unknown function (DUF4345)
MNAFARQSLWFNRVVLAGATLLFSLIGVRYIVDPVSEVAPHAITLGSPEAITMMRVSGAVFVGLAAVLFMSLVSDRRLRGGIAVLALVSIAVTAVRLFGLVVDGAGPFTLKVLKPEIALVLLSTLGFLFETRRVRAGWREAMSHPTLRMPSEAR